MNSQKTKEGSAVRNGNLRVGVLSSIRTKIVLLLIGAIILTTGIYLWTIIPLIKSDYSAVTHNYMNDVANSYGEMLDLAMNGGEDILNADNMKELIGDISINDISSSYAYAVNAEGIMLYHPTAEKIGQPVENEVVSNLVTQLAKGEVPEPDVVAYEFNGVMKYAAYYIGTDAKYILVITTDEDEIFAPINDIIERCIYTGIAILIAISILGFFVTDFTVKPINRITSVIAKLSDMDFTENDYQIKLNKRRDETGSMSRAISSLREQLREMVSEIKQLSEEIFRSADTLSAGAKNTAETMGEVEKTVAEIAQGATSHAQETQRATENVILMGSMVEETNAQVEGLKGNAESMRSSSDEAVNILGHLEEINKKTQDSIDTIYEQTNTTNESAVKIREATAIITSIAEETNLLSLNASIEAARAGEQGRGFAVVAAQIQKLAEQSDESARQIEMIVSSLISDSQDAVETMNSVKEVIGQQSENVNKTNDVFKQVKTGISNSAVGVTAIADRTKQLDEARVSVVDIVQNLTAIAEENAASTEETSASVTEVSAIIGDISDNAERLKEISDKLEEHMEIFKL
ncbi:methyl-accepting chemotaxis protein [Kineothrix sedimenti]|uniref:Methyl-accepting chemotaxis protein n=1 Tax=Kineothrix sedimenti TaxID=3123317 RepID=A0ABZ3ESG9_9FIRM